MTRDEMLNLHAGDEFVDDLTKVVYKVVANYFTDTHGEPRIIARPLWSDVCFYTRDGVAETLRQI